MTERQRKAKAKVKRLRNKRVRVADLDMETISRIDDGDCVFLSSNKVIDPGNTQLNAYAAFAREPGEVIEAGTFQMPPPGVVAENPLKPPSKFVTVKGRLFFKSASEYKRDMERYYERICQGAFHIPNLRPGVFVQGTIMRADQMGYSRVLRRAPRAEFSCSLYDVLQGYGDVVKRRTKVLTVPRMECETTTPAVSQAKWRKAFKETKRKKK